MSISASFRKPHHPPVHVSGHGEKIVVIYGCQRTGKTVNREAFRRLFTCDRIVDDFDCTPNARRRLRDRDLVLTNMSGEIARSQMPHAQLFHINEARGLIGLGAAPAAGFSADAGSVQLIERTPPVRRLSPGLRVFVISIIAAYVLAIGLLATLPR